MSDKEFFAYELELIHTIDSAKTSLWKKVLAVLELNAIASHH